MTSEFDFHQELAFSRGQRGRFDNATLMGMIPNARTVRDGSPDEDRKGIDKVVRLASGRELTVDLKTRKPGASKWWKGEPDLALERWSVKPGNGHAGCVGWTLDQAKRTDLVLFVYDPSDTAECFLVGFHHLRAAYLRFGKGWMSHYKKEDQSTEGRYLSQCVFVPASVVLAAITSISRGQLALDQEAA